MTTQSSRRALQLRLWALFMFFFIPGLLMASWATRTPAIRDLLALSTAEMGVVLFGLSVGSMSGILCSAWLVKRFGTRKVIRTTMSFAVLGMLVLSLALWLASAPLFAFGLAIFGASFGSAEVAINVEGAAVEREMNKTVLPMMHGFYSFGTLFGAGVGMAVTGFGLSAAPHILAAALVAILPIAIAIRAIPEGTGKNAAEAAHGDLGMITADDVLVAISYSGSSEELLKIVPLVKRQGAHLIALTGNPDSPLAREADVHLNGAVREEACPLNLAPTASTTAALALTDAVAVALLDARGFGPDDFARSHPGGALGRRLLTHVSDVMRSGDDVPRVAEAALLADALMEMTRAGLGMTAIVDADGRIVGIYTDGDLRRSLASGCNFSTGRIADVMSRNPKTIHASALAVEAAEMMERMRISELLVAGPDGQLVGALNHHDLMRAKVI